MKFKSYYSSSKGNLYCVTAANGKRLIIDPGVPWKKIQKALNYDLSNIVGALCTHSHADHSKAIEDVLQAGIDVFASKGTFDALGVEHRRAIIVRDKETCIITPGLSVFPFLVNHDAAEPLGYIVHDHMNEYCESLLFVTDTSHIKQKFGIAFNIIAICCNYDGDILHNLEEKDKINTECAKRLLTSHMELHVTHEYLKKFCCLDKCTEIHLLHMSESNIDKETVRAKFERDLMTKTIIAGAKRRQVAEPLRVSSRTISPACLF